MQSTALALMSCEKKLKLMAAGQAKLLLEDPYAGKYPWVPVYDVIIFCDLGHEPLS